MVYSDSLLSCKSFLTRGFESHSFFALFFNNKERTMTVYSLLEQFEVYSLFTIKTNETDFIGLNALYLTSPSFFENDFFYESKQTVGSFLWIWSNWDEFEINIKNNTLTLTNELKLFVNVVAIASVLICTYVTFLYDVKKNQKTWLFYIYFTVENFLWQIINSNLSVQYSDYVFFVTALFYIIFFCNIIGLIPYTFTSTSHICFTFTLSLVAFTMVTFVGIRKHGFSFYKLFLPSGAPSFMMPFIFIVEVISYCSRVFSLAIRLFANLMSGHTLLKLISVFTWLLFSYGIFFVCIPLTGLVLITFLETAIAFLQAYVFVVLVTIYFNDVLSGH